MKARIVIITSQHLYVFVKEAMTGIKKDCDIQILKYNDFHHAIEIYREYEDHADGFMLSGKAMFAAITKAFPNKKKPIVSFEASQIDQLKLLLELFLEDRQLDPKRVILDFLIPISDDTSVYQWLFSPFSDHIKDRVLSWLEKSSLEDLSIAELQIAEKLIDLWETDKIDYVICHYGSIIPILEQHKVPYRYSTPTRESILTVLESLLSQIELRRLHDNLTGVIGISACMEDGCKVSDERMKEIFFQIKNDLALDVVFQKEGGYCYIFSTLRVIEHITDHFRKCSIRFILKKKYHIEAYVGYGIGYNVTMAMGNARAALREALFSKGCFVVTEQNKVLGPLDSENNFEVKVKMSDEIFKIADCCKLSSITIQKLLSIIEMTGSKKITQQNLAEHLGVTSRNAGRILSNLVNGGVASVAYTKSMSSKGRPVKVYELNIKK